VPFLKSGVFIIDHGASFLPAFRKGRSQMDIRPLRVELYAPAGLFSSSTYLL
jgi:hypothetical protein